MYTHILAQDVYMQHLKGVYSQEVESTGSQAYVYVDHACIWIQCTLQTVGVLRMFPYLHMFSPLLWECCQCCACARQGSHVPVRGLWPTMHMALTVFYGCPSSQLIPVGVFEHSKCAESMLSGKTFFVYFLMLNKGAVFGNMHAFPQR